MKLLASTIGLILLTPALGAAAAQGDGFRLRVEPARVWPYGHDQHILTIHQVRLAPFADHRTAVTLDTRSGFSWRGGLEFSFGRWTVGARFGAFQTTQEIPEQVGAAGSGADEVRFEIADRIFTSDSPAEILFYRTLEDTELALWTADLYGVRTLIASSTGGLGILLGLRFADFDNDYRAAVGIENTAGVRLDASSNYRRMTGPLVGFSGTVRSGRLEGEGYLGQSVVMGEMVFDGRAQEFTGPFGESPAFFSDETIRTPQDVAIPISELRIRWTVRVFRQLALGAGVSAETWWDVRVPPGIVPLPGGDQVLHRNTMVFFGAMGVAEIRF